MAEKEEEKKAHTKTAPVYTVKNKCGKFRLLKDNQENILLTPVVELFNFGSARVFSELFPVCKKIVKMQ